MKVIVHYPKSEEGMKGLEKRVAECCAEAAIKKIQNMTCSTGQKVRLLDAVIQAVKDGGHTHVDKTAKDD